MESMSIYDNMLHSIALSENEMQILNKIALSSPLISAYDLSDKGDKTNRVEKDYSTVHKTCKKLINSGVLESVRVTNEKNVPKKVLKFTLFGFCLFVTQNELFTTRIFGKDLERFPVNDIAEQTKILKNWRHLHDAINWVYILLKKENIDEFERASWSLIQLYNACSELIDYVHARDFHGDEEYFRKSVDNEFFCGVFRNLFRWMITDYCEEGVVKNKLSIIEIVNLIKKSERGYPVIKKFFDGELFTFEYYKRINSLL